MCFFGETLVPGDFAGDKVNHVFGNVRGTVGNTLDLPCM